jgi:SAM-dependent methyltransferase
MTGFSAMRAGPCKRLLLLVILLGAGSAGLAQQTQAPAKPFAPSVGQAGKDVIWVPTPQALVDKMLDMAKVTPSDYVIDLGSGDGRTVITAAKRGARALGIEYEPDMVELSRQNAKREGVANRAEFVKADLFESDLSRATVVTMFLLPAINLKLRPTLLKLPPGTRVVSNTFTMGEWEPDEKVTLDQRTGCDATYCTALLWIVPAHVAGTHKTARGELTLTQDFQRVSGTLHADGKTIPVEGKVIGRQLVLAGGGRELRGRVNGSRVELS